MRGLARVWARRRAGCGWRFVNFRRNAGTLVRSTGAMAGDGLSKVHAYSFDSIYCTHDESLALLWAVDRFALPMGVGVPRWLRWAGEYTRIPQVWTGSAVETLSTTPGRVNRSSHSYLAFPPRPSSSSSRSSAVTRCDTTDST